MSHYIKAPGLPGRVFIPGDVEAPKKHPCPDCSACQFCSDTRCRACLRRGSAAPRPGGDTECRGCRGDGEP